MSLLTLMTVAAIAMYGTVNVTSQPLESAEIQQAAAELPAGDYTGACQVMAIDSDGCIAYPDTPPAICHLRVASDGAIAAEFPDEQLGRGEWRVVTLRRTTNMNGRATWTHDGVELSERVTAIPYSPQLLLFRMEVRRDDVLVAGAQQFFAIVPQHNDPVNR